MSEDEDRAFDALLAETLGPPARPADHAFVGRVDHAVAEAERYRQARARLWRGLGSDLVAILSLGASLATIARVPEVGAVAAEAPLLVGAAFLSLLVLWAGTTRSRVAVLA